MSELRWNPLIETWTITAANRQARPNMPKDYCPFCPGSGKVPDNYTVYVYPNDFPALSPNPPEPMFASTDLYPVEPLYGHCEVILFSPDHHGHLHSLPLHHTRELVDLWQARFNHFRADPKVQYIYAFENRGEAVGVTMPHPHGQIYAFPYIPLKLIAELNSFKAHFAKTGRDMMGDINQAELNDGRRIIDEGAHFISYLPFFTDFPYGLFITAKRMVSTFTDFTDAEKDELGRMLKETSGMFDALFDKVFPYMMCLHQAPVNSPSYPDADQYFRFHIEFYPPLRDANRIKYYASTETGAWAAANTRHVEETAPEMRVALQKFRQSDPELRATGSGNNSTSSTPVM